MGFLKEEKTWRRFVFGVSRWLKTLFVLFAMLISLLLFSAPILLVIADALLSSALLFATLPPPSRDLEPIYSQLTNYDFRSSLVDLPLISLTRSAVIFCVYSFCDGPGLSRAPYLCVAGVSSLLSLGFVSVKASYVFAPGDWPGGAATVALFGSSLCFAIGHTVVAYRTSCRERRKLLVYKIDLESVPSWKNGFPIHQKVIQGRKNELNR